MKKLLIIAALIAWGISTVANEPATTNLSPFSSNIVFSDGGMSGRFLYFEDWTTTRNYQIDSVVEHSGELWWAEADPDRRRARG